MLVLNPYPQTPFPRKGAILLGLPPLDPVGGYAPATPFLSTIEVFRQSVTGGRAARSLSLSVVEKSDSRECHCDTVLVAGVDNIIVTDGAAGLCYVFYTASVRSFNVVTEWEECI